MAPDQVNFDSELANPVWSALTGPQRRFGVRNGSAARYLPGLPVLMGLESPEDDESWDDLAALVGIGEVGVVVSGSLVPASVNWTLGSHIPTTQMAMSESRATSNSQGVAEIVRLDDSQFSEAAKLVSLTRPGPFGFRSLELGEYFGVHRGGTLLSMAGVRSQTPHWSEITAVCTHPDYRNLGLARLVVEAVIENLATREMGAFLHVAKDNRPAIRLYESMGFLPTREMQFLVVRRDE